jgi:TetR/AcrR family transcriptional regulator, cholesterol catabolism regulator
MEIQERIITKSEELFMRYGVKSVSMDEIAAHIGASKKTIYQYYPDKESLIQSVFKLVMEKNSSQCLEHQKIAENAVHEQFLSSDMVQEMFSKMNQSLLYETKKYYPKAYEEFEKHKRTIVFGIIKKNLERGIEEGLFRPELDVDIITWIHIESIALMFYGDDIAVLKKKPEQIEKEVTMFFLHGLCTTKGLKLVEKYKNQRQQ